jgi:hypothetical protein
MYQGVSLDQTTRNTKTVNPISKVDEQIQPDFFSRLSIRRNDNPGDMLPLSPSMALRMTL